MRKPTIYEIKRSNVLGEKYFSRENLNFFGQTLESFKVEWLNKEKGIVEIVAEGSFELRNPVSKIFGQSPKFGDYFTVKGDSNARINISSNPWVKL